MSATQVPPAKEYPAELEEVFARAVRGDSSVLPALKKAYDKHPELVDLFGSLFESARQALLNATVGDNLLSKEAMVRQADVLREQLTADAASPLERLLGDQICLDLLALRQAEMCLSEKLCGKDSSSPVAEAAAQRRDAAHRRFLTTSKMLATVKKLLGPALSALDMLKQPVCDSSATKNGVKRDILPVAEGMPVLN
jgi:hypothetical protein